MLLGVRIVVTRVRRLMSGGRYKRGLGTRDVFLLDLLLVLWVCSLCENSASYLLKNN